jgi:hypothetical protein
VTGDGTNGSCAMYCGHRAFASGWRRATYCFDWFPTPNIGFHAQGNQRSTSSPIGLAKDVNRRDDSQLDKLFGKVELLMVRESKQIEFTF